MIRVRFQARRDPLGCEFATGYLPDGTVFGTWFREAFPGAGTDPEHVKQPLEGSRILVRTTLEVGTYGRKPGIGHGDQMGLGAR